MKNNRRGGLGRGLGALIPTGPAAEAPGSTTGAVATAYPGAIPPTATNGMTQGAGVDDTSPVMPQPDLAPVPGAHFAEVPVDSIVPNAKQPRQIFGEEALEELKASIEQVGILQPIVVRALDHDRYELVMGERRWRAAQILGRELIPAIVRDTRDDDMLRDALLENIHRVDLNPLEEAAAYQQLLEEFGATHEELAKRIGRSRPQISNTIRLLNLPANVQRRVAAGVLSAGHARALLSLDDEEEQETLAHRIVAEGLSVRATEELVALSSVDDGTRKPSPSQRRPKPYAPGLSDLADRLADRFDTRVKVDIGRRKGRITIEFATVDDLERIVGIIGVESRRSRE